MNTDLMKTEFQVFEECEIVSKPSKNSTSKYDGLLKAIQNLDSTKSVKLSFNKYDLDEKRAVNLICSLRPLAKRKYGYRLGGVLRGLELYLWRNPN